LQLFTTENNLFLNWIKFEQKPGLYFLKLSMSLIAWIAADVTLACEDGHQLEAHKVI